MIQMQRRHFEFIAFILRNGRASYFADANPHARELWELMVNDFAAALDRTNPNFSPLRFRDACKGAPYDGD